MGKHTFNFSALLGRFLKVVMVAVVMPLAIGLFTGIREQLALVSASGEAAFQQWVTWGFVSYVGFHTLLYRPVTLFRASRRLFSTLALWLFGGQVSSVDRSAGGNGRDTARKAAGQGSTLVAFSPYVVPLSTVLVCVVGWLVGRWVERRFVDGPVGVLIGATIAFHWLMTADELQQQRQRWRVETYLLAIGLVFVVTLLIGAACLPLAVPGFSVGQAVADGVARAQAVYTTLLQRLFF
ncbi:MAG: hypothetical protein Q8R91_00470 [Candidatus Omnitrophota bacterium]|nr:hypothetical protein [Candidatus Omnitrophota bacterium]